jgi:hypothetical protein
MKSRLRRSSASTCEAGSPIAPRFFEDRPDDQQRWKTVLPLGSDRGAGGGAADWAMAAVASSSNAMTTGSASVSRVRIIDQPRRKTSLPTPGMNAKTFASMKHEGARSLPDVTAQMSNGSADTAARHSCDRCPAAPLWAGSWDSDAPEPATTPVTACFPSWRLWHFACLRPSS